MQDGIVSFIFRDPVSAATHLLWCLLGMYITALLWRLSRGNWLHQWSTGVFGLSMVLLYGASGVYHAVIGPKCLLPYLQQLDHSAIYVLIAGTYTPVFAVLLRGRLRIALLALVWGVAGAGIAAQWLLPRPPYWLTVSLYVGMGWVGIPSIWQLVGAVGARAMLVGLLGGLLYIFGGVCDVVKWPVLLPGVIGWHEVMHLADMGGTLIHVIFVVRYVLPFER